MVIRVCLIEVHLQSLQLTLSGFLSHFFISVLYDTFISVSLVFESTVNRTEVMFCMNKTHHESLFTFLGWFHCELYYFFVLMLSHVIFWHPKQRMQVVHWNVVDCIKKAFQWIWFTCCNSRLWAFPPSFSTNTVYFCPEERPPPSPPLPCVCEIPLCSVTKPAEG